MKETLINLFNLIGYNNIVLVFALSAFVLGVFSTLVIILYNSTEHAKRSRKIHMLENEWKMDMEGSLE